MNATTLNQALIMKKLSPIPAVIKSAGKAPGSGWNVVSRYEALTLRQRAGLGVAHEFYRHGIYKGESYAFHPVQFEIYGIQETQKGAALGIELKQLGLLQEHEGRFRISPAGIKLVEAVAIEQLES